jgi:hypothetical protein
MARRTRGAKAPPDSTDWRSYEPADPKYWMYGGPFVPPDEIPPWQGWAKKPGDIRPHERPATRLENVSRMLDDARHDLETCLARYVGLHERGEDALRWDWQKGLKSAPGEPTEVQKELAYAYREIGAYRQVIPVYESIVDGLDSLTAPLFHWNKGK